MLIPQSRLVALAANGQLRTPLILGIDYGTHKMGLAIGNTTFGQVRQLKSIVLPNDKRNRGISFVSLLLALVSHRCR